MWTDLDKRIEECRVKQLIAEMRFRFQLLQFQAELEVWELKVQIWVATHRGDVSFSK
jgi:hypothetical protein